VLCTKELGHRSYVSDAMQELDGAVKEQFDFHE
jgi:hypothetical protein